MGRRNINQVNNMKDIKVRTEEIDPYTQVYALDVDEESVQLTQYGQVGHPYPYILVEDVANALKSSVPYTNEDRMELLEEGYTYYWHRSFCPYKNESHRFIAVFSPTGQQITNSSHGFETLREALDYILDMWKD